MRKKVCFNENVTVYVVSGSRSERKSLWMQHAVDRFRFHREIDRLNSMLSKVIIHKLKQFEKNSTAAAAATAAADPAGVERVQFETADRVKFENPPRDQF